MKLLTNITLFLILIVGTHADAYKPLPCKKKPQLSIPPKFVNGQWIQSDSPSKTDLINKDMAVLKNKNYDFIFTGVYSNRDSSNKLNFNHIKVNKIWAGKLTETLDIKSTGRPSNPNCESLGLKQEYLFYGKLGNRKQPVLIKEFRLLSKQRLDQLGKPEKRWFRGRLINIK